MRNDSLRIALAIYGLFVIVPSWAGAQSSTVNCEPVGDKQMDGTYKVYAKGTYTYTSPGGGWALGGITDEYGILDEKGQFKKDDFLGGPYTAKVDTKNKTWIQDDTKFIGNKGATIWIRARLIEVNYMTLQSRLVAEQISKYTVPNE